jgi:hypothetical protein
MMPPESLYTMRALDYAELADHARDFKTREQLRQLAACWLRLAAYAEQQRTSQHGAIQHGAMAA